VTLRPADVDGMGLDRAGWCEAAGVAPDEVPAKLVLEGTWWWRDRLATRLPQLEGVRELRFPDMHLGRHGGQPVLFCCAYGAARAVEPVHAFGMMGSRAVVQIGSCGALQDGMRTGDVVLPEEAVVAEGASPHYGVSDASRATPALVDAAERALRSRGITVHRGRHLTTSALFAQPPGRVHAWRDAGYLAVDMETSAVFTVAAVFGMQAVSMLFVWDELLLGRTWLDPFSDEERALQRRANEAIFEVALGLEVTA
jgi:uridine phosphorylase